MGFKITEFSIGFGKALWQKTNKRGELISFRIFPLGGYCAFLGETDDEESEETKDKQKETAQQASQKAEAVIEKVEKENKEEYKLNEKGRVIYDESEGKFNDMRPWKRILVYFAGVTFNFISAFLFSIIFLAVGAYDGYKLTPTYDNVQYYVVGGGAEVFDKEISRIYS